MAGLLEAHGPVGGQGARESESAPLGGAMAKKKMEMGSWASGREQQYMERSCHQVAATIPFELPLWTSTGPTKEEMGARLHRVLARGSASRDEELA